MGLGGKADFSTCRHLCRSDLLAVCKNFFVRLLTSSAFSSVSMAADKSVFPVNSLRLTVGFFGLVKAIRESQAIGRCAETDSIEGWRDRLGASVPEANAEI